MQSPKRIFTALLFVALVQDAAGSDACSTLSIKATATVSVSDGSEFRISSLYQTPDHTAIRHVYPDGREQVIAVEGPTRWIRSGPATESGNDQFAAFALGHQYHALLLRFDDIVSDATAVESVEFGGRQLGGIRGRFPHGGTVAMVFDGQSDRAAGFVFEFGADVRIETEFSDWLDSDGASLPYAATIDDGEQVFEYRYEEVLVSDDSPLWFYAALPAPEIDTVRVHRLHRKLLAAHCLGDAAMMADLSTSKITIASRGELLHTGREDMRDRFGELFGFLDYRRYIDLAEPVIEIAESGDIGWIAVNVRTTAVDTASGRTLENTWAWVMMVRKVDGAWLSAGNASNVAPSP